MEDNIHNKMMNIPNVIYPTYQFWKMGENWTLSESIYIRKAYLQIAAQKSSSQEYFAISINIYFKG